MSRIGKLPVHLPQGVTATVGADNVVLVKGPPLIHNMVTGVSTGFTIKQELIGVGYRVEVKGQILELSLGYSHDIHFMLPSEIKAEAEPVKKGQNPVLVLKSCDKQLLGQVAAKIRSMRAPEPYKGKGIKFVGEQLRRKAGKSAGAK